MTIAEKIGLIVVVTMVPLLYTAFGTGNVILILFMCLLVALGFGFFLFGGTDE